MQHPPSTKTSSRRRTTTVIVLLIVTVVFGAGTYSYLVGHRLETQYVAFMAAEQNFETTAYKPSVGSNPVRQEVAYLLAQVLQAKMTPEQRLKLSREGIAHLNELESQIDAIQTEGEKVTPLLDSLEKTARSAANVRKRTQMKEVISLARKNAQVIADIRGLSYRADYYTDEVFERIIDEHGELTDAHKTYLNDLIPQLESQFDRRTNLYTELTQNSGKMKQITQNLGYASTP
jgi:prefoldin subunit 5